MVSVLNPLFRLRYGVSSERSAGIDGFNGGAESLPHRGGKVGRSSKKL